MLVQLEAGLNERPSICSIKHLGLKLIAGGVGQANLTHLGALSIAVRRLL